MMQGRTPISSVSAAQELSVLSRPDSGAVLAELTAVVSPEETAWVRTHYRDAAVSADVGKYIMAIVTATRESGLFPLGVSTRGALALYKSSQVRALLCGRGYVLPEDVLYMAPYVLCHRLGISYGGREQSGAFTDMLKSVPVPTEVI